MEVLEIGTTIQFWLDTRMYSSVALVMFGESVNLILALVAVISPAATLVAAGHETNERVAKSPFVE